MAGSQDPQAQGPQKPSQSVKSGEAVTVSAKETSKPASGSRSRQREAPDPKELLKKLLEGHLAVAGLQGDYQALYRNLPTVLGIAGEIMKRKQAGDRALEEGLDAVERILTDARQKAAKLSEEMLAQHDALEQLLENKETLTELVEAGMSGSAGAGPATPAALAGAISDPNAANQLNTMMENVRHMIASEVERNVTQLRSQIEQAISRQSQT